MKNVDFNSYVSDIFSLVKSIVIKFEQIALLDNKVVEKSGIAVTDDKTTWRYYMNLNGDYHQLDTLMYVTSIDDNTTILFNKTNLDIHLATKRAYKERGYSYNVLVDQFPDQILLINGILEPIDYNSSINSENYKILQYNKDLVLWNEDQLIPKLQDWINAATYQAFTTEYINTDNLMLPNLLEILHQMLHIAILDIRLESIGRYSVHEFFIWSKINSYGDFYKYKDALNNVQTLWLYRNIDWIIHNIGQQYTFNQLLENLLTKRDIPLASYLLTSDTTNQLQELTPTPIFIRENLNLKERYQDNEFITSVPQMLNKENPLARDNELYEQEYIDETTLKGEFALHAEIPTKVLESTMQGFSTRHRETFIKTLYYEWIYLAYHNVYQSQVNLIDPKTGKAFNINVKDALVLYQYLCAVLTNTLCDYIQPFYYEMVMKITPPSVDDLMKLGPVNYLPRYLCVDIWNLHLPLPRMISSEAFYDKCAEVYNVMWKHKKLYSQFMDANRLSRVKQACDNMYEQGMVEIATGLYSNWLIDHGFDFSQYTEDELLKLATDIFNKATGLDINPYMSLRVTQEQLLSLFKELSSYTIQIISNIDDGEDVVENIIPIDIGFNKHETQSIGNGKKIALDHYIRGHIYAQSVAIGKIDINKLNHEKVDALSLGYGQCDNMITLKPFISDCKSIAQSSVDNCILLFERKEIGN